MAALRAPCSSQATQTVVVGPGGVLKATNLDCSSLMFAGMLTDAMTSPVAADKVFTCRVVGRSANGNFWEYKTNRWYCEKVVQALVRPTLSLGLVMIGSLASYILQSLVR